MGKEFLPNLEEIYKNSSKYLIVIKQIGLDEFYIQSNDILVVEALLKKNLTRFTVKTYSNNELIDIKVSYFRTRMCKKIIDLLERCTTSYVLIGIDNNQLKYKMADRNGSTYFEILSHCKELYSPIKKEIEYHHKNEVLHNPNIGTTTPNKFRLGVKKYKI